MASQNTEAADVIEWKTVRNWAETDLRGMLEYRGDDGMIILKWIAAKCGLRMGTDLCGSTCGPLIGLCEHGNGLYLFTKAWNLLTRWATVIFSTKTSLHVVIRINDCFAARIWVRVTTDMKAALASSDVGKFIETEAKCQFVPHRQHRVTGTNNAIEAAWGSNRCLL